MRGGFPGARLNLHHEHHQSDDPYEHPGHRAIQYILILFRVQQIVHNEGQPSMLRWMLHKWLDKGIEPDDKPSDQCQPEHKEDFARPFHRSCSPSLRSIAGVKLLLKSRSWSRTPRSCPRSSCLSSSFRCSEMW